MSLATSTTSAPWQQVATPALFARTVSEGRWKLARHLQIIDRAITDTLTGKDGIRRLILAVPPRHGKSELCSKYLPAWYLGVWPDRRVILSSYEADFASQWGRKSRELLEAHGGRFGVAVNRRSSAADRWDLHGRDGGMQTAGVGGPITGKGANLLLVDDPIKNAEEAASKAHRQKIWEWWQSTAYTRLEPDGAAIVTATRWNEDDLTGRLLREMANGGERWRVVNLPAIGHDGAALWPERFGLEDLERIRRALGSYYWSALYQQRPVPAEGGIFKRAWLEHIVDRLPEGITRAIRYWDKASTEDGGDYTVGVLICEHEGLFYVVDVFRAQLSPHNRNKEIRRITGADAKRFEHYSIWAEEEGGSGGKESAHFTIADLREFDVHTERVSRSGDKVTRARPLAAQAEAGNVRLVRAPWNLAFVDELCMFPNGANDDQVDAASGAYNKAARPRKTLLVS